MREPLSTQAATELAGMLKALSDPVRLRLLSVVASHAGGEACVCDISAGITVGQPTVSHHLKVLREAGLLDSERRGSWVYYRVIPEALQQLSRPVGRRQSDRQPDNWTASGCRGGCWPSSWAPRCW